MWYKVVVIRTMSRLFTPRKLIWLMVNVSRSFPRATKPRLLVNSLTVPPIYSRTEMTKWPMPSKNPITSGFYVGSERIPA